MKRQSKSEPGTPPTPEAGVSTAGESRNSRRKRETRKRLLEAAYRLFAERGVDAVAINEITEAADVGFGSFYNHFESKGALHAALVATVFEHYADALEAIVCGIGDAAEIVSVSVRHTLLRAAREPMWGHFLLREGLLPEGMSRGLALRFARDVQRGVDSGRFEIPDAEMAVIAGAGTVLGAVGAILRGPRQAGRRTAAEGSPLLLPRGGRGVAERAAGLVLHILGLSFEEADEVARRPLPPVDVSPLEF